MPTLKGLLFNQFAAEGLTSLVEEMQSKYTAKKGRRFNHDNITGNCSSCHNGTIADGKTASHIPSNDTCENCHSTTAWIPATFSHDNLTTGCNTCHNGVTATGMDPGHFITSEQCDVCHRTGYWIPVLAFVHQSANYPGDHTGSNPECIDCHTTNSQTIPWSFEDHFT